MSLGEEWVIWNESLGIAVTAVVGQIHSSANGRRGWLAPPWDIAGPFDLDQLEATGCIAFGECLVMSRARWRQDQIGLRIEGREKRRDFALHPDFRGGSREHRKTLDLPVEGALQATEINAAFRRRAKSAHPDAGGNSEDYRRITEARDALIAQTSGVA